MMSCRRCHTSGSSPTIGKKLSSHLWSGPFWPHTPSTASILWWYSGLGRMPDSSSDNSQRNGPTGSPSCFRLAIMIRHRDATSLQFDNELEPMCILPLTSWHFLWLVFWEGPATLSLSARDILLPPISRRPANTCFVESDHLMPRYPLPSLIDWTMSLIKFHIVFLVERSPRFAMMVRSRMNLRMSPRCSACFADFAWKILTVANFLNINCC